MKGRLVWWVVGALGSGVMAAPSLQVQVGPQGLTALRYYGGDLLYRGALQVTGVFFRKWDGEVYAGDIAAGRWDPRAGRSRVRWTYPWGEVRATYIPQRDRLHLEVAITTRRTADTLVALYLQLMELRFPTVPQFFNRSFFFYAQTNMAHNLGGPGWVSADYGPGLVVLAHEEVGPPLSFGFADPLPNTSPPVYPVLAFTGRHPQLREKWPFIDRPVPPGGTDRWLLSLRFAPSGASPDALVEDLYQAYARAYPFRLQWPDRRPIGCLFLSSAHGSLEDNYPTNPRGWFNDPNVDVTTAAGRAEFQARLLQWANQAVQILRQMDAQGMILWDPEGQEYPHMTSYLGDPRSLPPEMEPVIDEFFRRFGQAGLRTGICLRPQRPVRLPYTEGVFQLSFTDRRDRLANLAEKVETARQRWGCTLFYLDSNVDWYGDPVAIPGAEGYSATVDDDLLRELTARYPDILVIPEWETLRTFAYGAPYSQLDYNKLVSTPDYVRRTYPQAFLVNMVGEKEADQYHDALVEAVRRGDILFFLGWWPSPENAKVRRIYEEARGKAGK